MANISLPQIVALGVFGLLFVLSLVGVIVIPITSQVQGIAPNVACQTFPNNSIALSAQMKLFPWRYTVNYLDQASNAEIMMQCPAFYTNFYTFINGQVQAYFTQQADLFTWHIADCHQNLVYIIKSPGFFKTITVNHQSINVIYTIMDKNSNVIGYVNGAFLFASDYFFVDNNATSILRIDNYYLRIPRQWDVTTGYPDAVLADDRILSFFLGVTGFGGNDKDPCSDLFYSSIFFLIFGALIGGIILYIVIKACMR